MRKYGKMPKQGSRNWSEDTRGLLDDIDPSERREGSNQRRRGHTIRGTQIDFLHYKWGTVIIMAVLVFIVYNEVTAYGGRRLAELILRRWQQH